MESPGTIKQEDSSCDEEESKLPEAEAMKGEQPNEINTATKGAEKDKVTFGARRSEQPNEINIGTTGEKK